MSKNLFYNVICYRIFNIFKKVISINFNLCHLTNNFCVFSDKNFYTNAKASQSIPSDKERSDIFSKVFSSFKFELLNRSKSLNYYTILIWFQKSYKNKKIKYFDLNKNLFIYFFRLFEMLIQKSQNWLM